MKNLALLLLLPFATFAQTNPVSSQFVIKGSFKDVADSTLVYLTKPGEANEVYATAYTKKGNFTMFGKLPAADIYQVTIMGIKDPAYLFIGNEKVTVTGVTSNLNGLQVTGSVVHADYMLYKSRFTSLEVELNTLAGKINQTQPGPERDQLMQQFEAGKKKVMAQVGKFIQEKPASPVTAFLIYVTSPIGGDIDALESRYGLMKATAKKSYYGAEIEKMILSSKIGMEGTMAVDFTQPDQDSKPVSLSSFKGKYVLVDFWASWCGPCRVENPAVVAAYNAFKDKNFTIFGVSLDNSKEKWLKAVEDDKLAWTQVSDLKFWQNEAAQLYKVGSIPANFLIDPSGKIIARNLRGEELYKRLQKELK